MVEILCRLIARWIGINVDRRWDEFAIAPVRSNVKVKVPFGTTEFTVHERCRKHIEIS